MSQLSVFSSLPNATSILKSSFQIKIQIHPHLSFHQRPEQLLLLNTFENIVALILYANQLQ